MYIWRGTGGNIGLKKSPTTNEIQFKGNANYHFCDGIGYGELPNGMTFKFDESRFDKICNIKWYPSYEGKIVSTPYLIDHHGKKLHAYLVDCPKGHEVDHINLDTLDNRLSNLRICTHQQNQCNQPLQRNNTSGVTGVRFYKPRGKYVSRIKVGQKDIHLGYYPSFIEAVQARNVGMECMFGEYGRYNDVPPAPDWIKNSVIERCKRFAELSVCEAFHFSEVVA